MKIVFHLSCLVSLFSVGYSFLIVPPTAPTRHQWIAGIGIPLDLENIAVTTGYVFKAQYFLPTKVEHLFPENTWEGLERVRRDVDNEVVLVDNSTGTRYSSYDVPVVVIEEGRNGNGTERKLNSNAEDAEDEDNFWNDDEVATDSKSAQAYWDGMHDAEDQGSDNSRWDAYKMLEGITNNHGMGGKHCVLRTICESAAAPISHKSGIFGELLHILLTPSSSSDTVTEKEHEDYLLAEKFGKEDRGSCDEEYPDCDKSLIDVFTSFQSPFETLFNTYQ